MLQKLMELRLKSLEQLFNTRILIEKINIPFPYLKSTVILSITCNHDIAAIKYHSSTYHRYSRCTHTSDFPML